MLAGTYSLVVTVLQGATSPFPNASIPIAVTLVGSVILVRLVQ